MIRFFYEAGSEQTRAAMLEGIRRDLAAGDEVLLLVPEQETVSTERRMLECLPPAAQLCFEVVNFSRLANRVFRAVGGHRFATATPAVRALLMWKTLRQLAPQLQRYGTHAAEPRLCDMMLDTAAKCRAYCIKADDLLGTADILPEGEPLAEKLRDLGSVIGCFEAELDHRFDGGEDDLDRLAQLLQGEATSLFARTHIYVDSFTDYTKQEIEILRALMRCALSVSFSFPLESAADDGIHLSSAVATHRLLRRIADELALSVEFVRGKRERAQSAREYFSRNVFRMNAEPAPLEMATRSDLCITLCDDPFAEAEAAAAEIQRLVRDGCRYRDITVVLRDASSRIGILDAALEREGIPFFLSEKTDVTTRPLVKLILLALRIHQNSWRDEDVVSYLKTGLCGLAADDINLFEEYVNVWHPRGERRYAMPFTRNPDGYGDEPSARGVRILEGANRVRAHISPPLTKLFADLNAAKGATAMCRALYGFLCSLGIAEQLKAEASAALAAGERRDAEELSRLYGVVVEALDAIALALGDEPLSVAQLSEALRLAFSRTDIGSIPTSADEVTIGSASMLRADHPRHVLILGLNDGEFPKSVSEDGLLSDAEKEHLRDHGLEFPSNRAERASDELFFIYRALCAPRDTLYLSYNKATASGAACAPSIVISRAKTLFPGLSERSFATEDALDHIFSAGAALDRFSELPPHLRGAIRALLEEMEIPAAKTLDQPVVQRTAALSAQTASDIYGNARFSPSMLESFSACRFAYYCERILRLRSTPGDTLESRDVGNFIHYMLEHVLKDLREEGGLNECDSDKLNALVDKVYTGYIKMLESSGELPPRTKAQLSRLRTLAILILSALSFEFIDSDFTPAVNEFDLQKALGNKPLRLQSGLQVPLSGKADRLDVWRSPKGESYLRVVDYKTGTRAFDVKDVEKGFSLQMPLYLMALCHQPYPALNALLGLPEDTRLKPAGVTYFSSALTAESTPCAISAEQAMANAAGRMKRSGVLLSDPEVLHAASNTGNADIVGTGKGKAVLSEQEFSHMFSQLESTLERLQGEIRGGDASALPHEHGGRLPCEYCRYAAICRASGLHVKGEGDEA